MAKNRKKKVSPAPRAAEPEAAREPSQETLREPLREARAELARSGPEDLSATRRGPRPQQQQTVRRGAAQRARPRRSAGHVISMALLYVIFVLGISALLACLGWIAANDVLALNKPSREVTLTITAQDDFDDVLEMLKENGLIESKQLFRLFARFTHGEEKLASSGTFTLNSDMDYHALIAGLSANSTARAKVNVTIPEGYTIDQIFSLLEERGVATIEDLRDTAMHHDYNFSFLKDLPLGDYKRLEGFLYPDTYEFYTPHDPVTALNKLLVRFDSQYTDSMRERTWEMGYTVQEMLTIASMIEKETDGQDRARIASVIYNRLNNPSYETAGLLQIDATIFYVIGRTVTQGDRDGLDSPYNTFRSKGLPPTPIANPGMESINAALHPSGEKYYYYALGDDDLHHYFQTYSGLQRFLNEQKRYQ